MLPPCNVIVNVIIINLCCQYNTITKKYFIIIQNILTISTFLSIIETNVSANVMFSCSTTTISILPVMIVYVIFQKRHIAKTFKN